MTVGLRGWTGLLIGLTFNAVVHAHELCLNFEGPFEGGAGTGIDGCPAWRTFRTCPPVLDANEIGNGRLNVGGRCAKLMQRMSCAEIDAWSAHLYEAEGVGSSRRTPFLCRGFARRLYRACKRKRVEEFQDHPFVRGFDADQRFEDVYPTFSDFEKIHSRKGYCTAGKPFKPKAPRRYSGSEFVCLEKSLALKYPDKFFVTAAPIPGFEGEDSLLALASQNGLIYIASAGSAGSPVSILHTFADLRDRVFKNENRRNDERGLLGLVFHKDFQENGRVFVSYSCGSEEMCGDDRGDTAIEMFQVGRTRRNDKDKLKLRKRNSKLLLTVEQPAGNHNGGQILFSPSPDDPYLYIMLGDGGGSNDRFENAQDTTSLLGKVLRIDVDSKPSRGKQYAIPADNPFVDLDSQVVRHEIYALGLRNPWRCSFDRKNPAYLICGDVGQNAVEEIDLIVKGANYGWSRFEGGNLLFPNKRLAEVVGVHTPPVLSYTHKENNPQGSASVTGGYFYRGPVAELEGLYVFADLYDRLFLAQEYPPLSGQFSYRRVGIKCAASSPLQCSESQNGSFNFIETVSGDLFLVSMSGLHRFVACSSQEQK